MLIENRGRNSSRLNVRVWLFAVILMVPSLFWAVFDRSLWGYDPVWYGETTVDLWWYLFHNPIKWLGRMLLAFGDKAPGIAWFGQFFVPLGELLGSIELGLRISVLLYQSISLVLVYFFIDKVFEDDKLLPLIAMLTMASSPLFVGMSHHYFVEPLQLLGITWLFLIAVYSFEWNRERTLRHLLGATCLAMIAKASSPLYGFLPGLVAFRHAIRKPPGQGGFFGFPGSRERALAIAQAVFALFTFSWYVRNLKGVFRHVALSSTGEVAIHYGSAAPMIQKLWYWLKALCFNLSYWPGLCLFGCVFAFVLIKAVRKTIQVRLKERWSIPNLFALLSSVIIIGVLLVFSLSVNEEVRFLLPLLVPFTFLFVWFLYTSKSKTIMRITVIVLSLQFLTLAGQALGIMEKDKSVSHWLREMSFDETRKKEIKAVVEKTCTEDTADRYNLCGVDYSWLNAASLKFYAAQKRIETGYRCSYHMLGYAEDSVARALDLVDTVKPCFFVSVDREHQELPPDFLNKVSGPVLDAIEKDPSFENVPHESSLGVVIYRNITAAPCGLK